MRTRPWPYRLALPLLAAAGMAHTQTTVSRLIVQLRSPNPAIRDVAARQLGKTHSSRAVQPLIVALQDTNLHVAQDAATSLGQLHATNAIQPLMESLRHTYCSGIVYGNPKAPAALSAIGMTAVSPMLEALNHSSYGMSGDISFPLAKALDGIPSPQIVPPLAALLQNSTEEARIYAADRLAAHPGPAAVDALLPLLNDPNKYVRSTAIRALGKNPNDPRVIPALRAAAERPSVKPGLVDESDDESQISALSVLGHFHDPTLIPVFLDGLQYTSIGEDEASKALLSLGPIAIGPLIEALGDDARPPEARYWAALTLGNFDDFNNLNDARILPALLAASHSPHRRVREGAFTSATADTNPGFTNRLLTALAEDKSWHVRQISAYALEKHDDPRINSVLEQALKDRNENVRAAAASSLAKRHDTDAVPELIDYMHGSTVLDHQAAAGALGTLGDPRAIVPLIRMLARPNSGDCYPVSEALAHLAEVTQDPDLFPKLRQTLAQPNSSHCGPALALLSRDPGSLKFLTAHLDEDRPENGNTPAYKVLNGSKGSDAVEPAIAALNSPDASTRAHAAKILSANQRPGAVDPRAIMPLLHALGDTDEDVRENAAIALINVDDTRKIRPFANLLHSPDFAMREDAADALGHVHDPRAVAALVAALADPDFNTHRGVMDALQHNTYPPVLPALFAALRSSNPQVRASAAEALRYRTEPSVAKALIPLQHDSDVRVREAAMQALSGCPMPQSMD